MNHFIFPRLSFDFQSESRKHCSGSNRAGPDVSLGREEVALRLAANGPGMNNESTRKREKEKGKQRGGEFNVPLPTQTHISGVAAAVAALVTSIQQTNSRNKRKKTVVRPKFDYLIRT